MKSNRAWWAMLLCYVSLFGLLLTGTYASAPEHVKGDEDILGATLIFWLLKCIPLLLFIPGIIKKSHHAASWLSYMAMFYFVVIIATGAGIWMWLQVLTIALMFIAALMFTRWKKAEEQA